MPRPKKERGRPMENRYPPRIDATAEELAQALLKRPPSRPWAYDESKTLEYRCNGCSRPVHYPETLYKGGLCENCRQP